MQVMHEPLRGRRETVSISDRRICAFCFQPVLCKKISPTIQEEAQKVMPLGPAATFPCCAVCADIRIPGYGSIKKCVVPPGNDCNMC